MKWFVLPAFLWLAFVSYATADHQKTEPPTPYTVAVETGQSGNILSVRAGLFLTQRMYMVHFLGTHLTTQFNMGTVATFLDLTTFSLYGFDWIASGIQASYWLGQSLSPDNSSREFNSKNILVWPLAFEMLVLHPHLKAEVFPLMQVGTGWDLDIYCWKERAVVWTPYLSFTLQEANAFFGPVGPFLEGRIQYTLAASTGPLAAAMDKHWGYGVAAGWRF